MKITALTLTAILTLLLSGCAIQGTTTAESGTSEPPAASGAASEPTEKKETAAEATATPAEPATAAGGTDTADTADSGTDTAQTTPNPTEPPASSAAPPQTAPAPTEPPVMPEPTPQPTDPPKPKTAYDAPYDTAAIIADAKAYGESIGMTWSEPLTVDNCSWEAPGATSSTLSGERLKTAIEGRIARIKKLQGDNEYQPGEFHFKVVFEPQGNGEHTIHFLMG
jgi:hypothetical protein